MCRLTEWDSGGGRAWNAARRLVLLTLMLELFDLATFERLGAVLARAANSRGPGGVGPTEPLRTPSSAQVPGSSAGL